MTKTAETKIEQPRHLVVVGDPVIDHIYTLENALQRGGKSLGRYVGAQCGGTTSNFACAASRYGLKVSMLGRVASGVESETHKDSFRSFGVDTSSLIETEMERGTHTIIAIDEDGEKTLVYAPFGNEQLPRDVLFGALSAADWVYTMAADFQSIEDVVQTTQTRICIDVDAAAGVSKDQFEIIRELADVIFINEVGFRALTQCEPSLERCKNLLGSRTQIFCCTGGEGQSFFVDARSEELVLIQRPAFKAEVLDTTGAGDCFNAAFMAKVVDGSLIEEAASFAMAAGSIATESIGARQSIPSLPQINSRLEKLL